MTLSRRTLLRNSLITAAAAAVPALAQTKPSSAAPTPPNPQVDDLKRAFQRSRAFTLDVANAMPEEKYNFRTVPEVRSFGQQMVHIGHSLRGIFEQFIEDKKASVDFSEDGKEQFTSKASVVADLEQHYQYVQDAVAKLDDAALDRNVKWFGNGTVPMRRAVRVLLDHCTHHRGQAVQYLRINGIKPPDYRA